MLEPRARRTLKRPLDLLNEAGHAVNDMAKRRDAGSLVNEVRDAEARVLTTAKSGDNGRTAAIKLYGKII